MDALCTAIIQNDGLPAEKRKSNVALAEEWGTSEASIRRARKRLKQNTTDNASKLTITGSKDEINFEGLISDNPIAPDADNSAFDRVFQLAGVNSDEFELVNDTFRFSTWQQSAFNPETKSRDTIQLYSYSGSFKRIDPSRHLLYEDLAEIIGRWMPPRSTTTYPAHVPVLNLSDLQIGKAMEEGGGTEETVERVRDAVQEFCASYLPAREAVLVDGGDIIENMFNTPSQPYTNDLDLAAQIRVARRLMLDAILTISKHVGTLYYVSIPSNHGQVRSGAKAQAGTVDADFGLEISYQLEDAITLNDDLAPRVQFVRPAPREETAVLKVANTKLAFNHGHRIGNQDKGGIWWGKQDHGRKPGWDADILVLAHYHTMYVRQSGNGRWVIGVASPEPGSGWFSLATGETSTKGCTAFTVQDGMWGNLRIL